MYINSLNYFRAIAILFIVAGHCLGISDFSFSTIGSKTIYNIIAGGTTPFVFISGFLFHHIFSKNFVFKTFYLKKIKFVFLPYVLLALIPILLSVFAKDHTATTPNYYSPTGQGLFSQYLIPILKHYATGSMFIGYWYIPFVMIVFACAPLHIRFINLSTQTKGTITAILFIIALFIHRPLLYTSTIAIFQAVLYFTPVYFIGILSSENKELIYKKFKNKEIYVLLLVIGIALAQTLIGKEGSYNKLPLHYDGIDLMLLQKSILSIFFMVWLHRFERKKIKVLKSLADASFGIFFVHCLVIIVVIKTKKLLHFSFPPNNPLIYILIVCGITLFSFAIVHVIKKITPKYSRYFIGS